MKQKDVKDVNDVNGANNVLLLTDKECARQVGQRLCQVRQFLGLTTQDLAQFLRTTDAKITEVEQGKFFLPISWSIRLSQYLGINLIWLLSGEGKILDIKNLFYYMRVPIIEENVFNEFSKAKVLLKERIREYKRGHEVSLNGGLQ